MSDIDIPPEMRLKYLERRKADFESCQKAIIENNFEVLKRVGHQIKGNASTFGYDDLSKIAIELEQCAEHQEIDKLKSIMEQFANFLSRTQGEASFTKKRKV